MNHKSAGSNPPAAINQKKPDNAVQENKMGVMPVNRLLISMSLPMVISMLVQALYNVVDSAFVARISTDPIIRENALSALSLAFPLQNLMISVSVGTGVGMNALLSRSLGEKNQKIANRTAGNGLTLAFLSYIAFALFGFFGVDLFLRAQTDIAQILEFGSDYLSIVSIFSFGLFGQVALERLLQSTGRTVLSMVTQATGAIINIILDPILIFGLLGFQPMGVKGAAVATVIGQAIAMFLSIFLNLRYNKELDFKWKYLILKWNVVSRIFYVGIPSIVMSSISSVMTFILNKILIVFSSAATAVFGVYFKLQSFIFMPVFGLNNGMVPIIAYNYGAKKKKRITDTIRLSVIYAVSLMLIGLIIFQVFPEWMLGLFNASEEMLAIGVPALRIISISFIFAGFSIVACSVYQALGNGMYSLFVSIARQLIVLIPAAYILSLFNQLWMVWLAFPISEIVSMLMCVLFLWLCLRKLKF